MKQEDVNKINAATNALCERDIILYGCAACLKNDDGTFTHIPAEKLRFNSKTDFSVVPPLPFEL
jgi:hypothetical protein